MNSQLPFAQDIQAARAAVSGITCGEQSFFEDVGREVIAQAALTLTVKQGRDWTATDLIEQIQAPRETFEASGLEDGRMDNLVFKAENRQRDSVIAMAVYMAQKAFGSPSDESSDPIAA